ncbi:MAG: hypothetical protein Q4E52_12920, partial [Fibrobacter sp.]|nr:hypothetical protein [Fibrobacter sp.]
AFGYEPKGSRFESWHPQKKAVREILLLFSFYTSPDILFQKLFKLSFILQTVVCTARLILF